MTYRRAIFATAECVRVPVRPATPRSDSPAVIASRMSRSRSVVHSAALRVAVASGSTTKLIHTDGCRVAKGWLEKTRVAVEPIDVGLSVGRGSESPGACPTGDACGDDVGDRFYSGAADVGGVLLTSGFVGQSDRVGCHANSKPCFRQSVNKVSKKC